MKKRILPGLAVVDLATLLTACGFQLRGTGETRLTVNELNLTARDAYGQTVKDVRDMLEDAHVRITSGAPYTLDLGGEAQSERTASYTSGARSAEVELTTRQPYTIVGKNQAVLVSDYLETQRYYVTDQNNIVGSEQQKDQLRREMRRELVQQLAARLQALTPERLDKLQRDADARAAAKAEADRRARESAPPQQSPIEIPTPAR